MQAERHSLSKGNPKFFKIDFREVVGNYFHNDARFVIFHLDPSNHQQPFEGLLKLAISKQIP